VIELRGIEKRYGALEVFGGLDFDIDRGDRIAFVGVNGAGKSTLARIIAGVEPIDGGERIPGHHTIIGYFAQHQAEELHPGFDVLQTVESVATGEVRKHLRGVLGCFLFSGDDVFKRVGVLSGGEKSRLALAKMLLQPSNLIVMDEPTNHLDLRSKGVLQEALLEYEGSCVIVSHDRDFLDPLVNKVVEFRDGGIRVYPGNVSEFLDARKRETERNAGGETGRDGGRGGARGGGRGEGSAEKGSGPPAAGKERKRAEAERRQKRYARTRPVQEKIASLERQIAAWEEEKKEIETAMADGGFYRDGEHAKVTSARYRGVQEELTNAYYRWGELNKELEELNRLFDAERGTS
jgi:ATP-binding cassette subfamily F protein 3